MFENLPKQENIQPIKDEPIAPIPPKVTTSPVPSAPIVPESEGFAQRLARLRSEVKTKGSNNKLSFVIGTIVILLLIGGAAGAAYYFSTKNKKTDSINNQVACTQEAKLCPDGTSVGRSGSNCEFTLCPTIGQRILDELQKYNIIISGQPKKLEITFPDNFTDANWGVKKFACEQGGYDITFYSGKTVSATTYETTETYQNEPLDVWALVSDDNIICLYKAVGPESNIAPGIFSVKPDGAATSTPSGTADWQTYKNEEYGFEVKYPKEWELKSINNIFSLQPIESANKIEEPTFSIEPIRINGKDVSEIFNGQIERNINFETECTRTTISGKNSYICLPVVAFAGEKLIIILYNKDLIVKVTDFFNSDTSNQILSTFKFIEPTATSTPQNLDTDNDGLLDADEVKYGTDAQNPDSDGDSYLDGEEVENGYNPLGPGKMSQ